MFHFFVVELKTHPHGARCPALSQPGLKWQWKQPSVQAWYLDLTAGQPCRLPVSGCARLLIDLSGTTTFVTPTGTYNRQPDGFVYIAPGSGVDIRGNRSRCVLLEMQ
jgi:hypothetical protein